MSNTSSIRRFMQPAIDQWRMYLIGVGVMSSRFFFDIFTVWTFKYTGKFIETWDYEKIYQIFVIYTVVFILYYIWKYIIKLGWRAKSRYAFAKVLRRDYSEDFFSLDATYIERMGTGRTISLIQDGINNWIDALLKIQYETPNLIIKLWFTLILLSSLGYQYIIAFLILCFLVQFFVSRINRNKMAPLRLEKKKLSVDQSRQFVRMVMWKQEIVYTDKVEHEVALYSSKVQQQKLISDKVMYYVYFMFNIPLIVVQALGIVALFYAYTSIRDGTFSIGLFAALIAMIWYLSQLMLQSTESFKELWDQFIHIEKLREFFDGKGYTDYDSGNAFHFVEWKIRAQNLSFWYEQWKMVFDNFNLELLPRKRTALVGVSGGGKTTLIKLIAWYMSPTEGALLVDDQDLSKTSLRSYYKHVWYLTQDPNVFDGEVYENLLYALPHTPTDEQIKHAIESAKCEFVYDLPQGIHTEIWERGVKLSGGQRQRLAIAKIMLKNPDIILLDEPTSSLDSYNEEQVTLALNNLFKGKTVIIIAHRLQTVKHSDDIIYLSHGKVIERWTHQELISLWWEYYKMVELQSWF